MDTKVAPTSTWTGLVTEARHPGTAELDLASPQTIVTLVLEEDRRGLDAALAQREAIAAVAARLGECLAAGGDIVLVGAGTSGRLGVLEAAECPPTFGTDPARVRAAIAGGLEAVFAAREGAEDRHDEGEAAVAGCRSLDVVVGISASSVTPFVLGALSAARAVGATTVLLTCAAPSVALAAVADYLLALGTGPEVLTGSTRLKAGSATKAVLNALTTAAMVSVGKVYSNLMVDVRPGSAKLRDRAVRIVAAATGVDRDEALRLHGEAGGEVKTAIVMALAGVDSAAARARLAAARGHVRHALG